jgi:hypothetical protein
MVTYEQYMSAIRWLSTVGGTMLASYGFAVNSPLWQAAMGVVVALAPFAWSMFRHTTLGTVIAADNVPAVAGVIMKQTTEGRVIADNTPTNPTIVAAGTNAAAQVAGAAAVSRPL